MAGFRFFLAGAICAAAAIAACGADIPARRISGDIAFSAGTSGVKSYLSLSAPIGVTLNAAMPLRIDGDFVRNLSITAAFELENLEAAAGKLAIRNGASFFVSAGAQPVPNMRSLSISALGYASSPWGAAISALGFSGFAAVSEASAAAAVQYLFPKTSPQAAVSLGALIDIGEETALSRRIAPWAGFGARFEGRIGKFGCKAQVIPNLSPSGGDSLETPWLRGAACGVDFSIRARGISMQGGFYGEYGEFSDALGKIAKYDARILMVVETDFPEQSFGGRAKMRLSVDSKQGAGELAARSLPAGGALPGAFTLRYWPDKASISASLESKAVRIDVLRAPLLAVASLTGSCAAESLSLSARIGLAVSLRGAENCSRLFGLAVDLWSSMSRDDEADIEESGLFSDIAEYEAQDDASLLSFSEISSIEFNRLRFSLRAAYDSFSCAASLDLPLTASGTREIGVKLRVSAKVFHFLLESSLSFAYSLENEALSISSTRIYAKIPL